MYKKIEVISWIRVPSLKVKYAHHCRASNVLNILTSLFNRVYISGSADMGGKGVPVTRDQLILLCMIRYLKILFPVIRGLP